MVKVVGQIVELDPNKKYVMLIDRGAISHEDLQMLGLYLQKQEGSLMTVTLPSFDSVRFVENSDRIIDVVEAKPKEE